MGTVNLAKALLPRIFLATSVSEKTTVTNSQKTFGSHMQQIPPDKPVEIQLNRQCLSTRKFGKDKLLKKKLQKYSIEIVSLVMRF